MSTNRERQDLIRGEDEGFVLRDMGSEDFLSLFLGRVSRTFKETTNIEHLEDASIKVVAGMTEVERFQLESIFSKQENPLTLSTYLKNFLGEAEWKELETLERNRILEFDQHRSEGTG